MVPCSRLRLFAAPRLRLFAAPRLFAAVGAGATVMLAACAFAAPVASSAARTLSASSTADCDSVTTCYTPQQIQVAYGLRPLLDRGIDEASCSRTGRARPGTSRSAAARSSS